MFGRFKYFFEFNLLRKEPINANGLFFSLRQLIKCPKSYRYDKTRIGGEGGGGETARTVI